MSNETSKPKSVFDDLDKGINPQTGQAAPPASLPALPAGSDLATLIQLLGQQAAIAAKREAREEAEFQAKQATEANREKQRNRTAKGQEKGALIKQAKCRHMKGGKHANRVDYALMKHMLIDRKVWVACLICKMKWYPGDTKEFLIRGSKKQKVSNYTHLGWAEVNALFAQSSNTQTMSEVPLGNITTEGIEVATDASGMEVDLSLRDEHGQVVEAMQY